MSPLAYGGSGSTPGAEVGTFDPGIPVSTCSPQGVAPPHSPPHPNLEVVGRFRLPRWVKSGLKVTPTPVVDPSADMIRAMELLARVLGAPGIDVESLKGQFRPPPAPVVPRKR